MADQETGTAILNRARIYAQDNDANSNYAVSDANALIVFNDLLMALSNNVAVKPYWYGAATTGLTFGSGVISVTSTAGLGFTEIESFHSSSTSSVSFPVTPKLIRVSVQEIHRMLNFDGDTAVPAQAAEWTHVAAEKEQNLTSSGDEAWRVWGYPVINRTRYMTVCVPKSVQISALSNTPDIEPAIARPFSRLLAYEIAKLKKDTSQEFLNGIISMVPKELVNQVYGGAILRSQMQDRVLEVRD